MGFKEVMNLRQAGNLDEALTVAKADLEQEVNQWSASALFWVLRDLVYRNIKEGKNNESEPLLREMQRIIPDMGATAVMAQDTLSALEKEVVPHYIELSQIAEGLRTERNKYKVWTKLGEAYKAFKAWDVEEAGIDPRLHEQVASILTNYVDQKGSMLPVEEFRTALDIYLRLTNERPSRLHDKMLKIVLKAKNDYMRKLSVHDFFERWGMGNLDTEYAWQRPMNKHYQKSLGELTLHTLVLEDLDLGHENPAPETVFLFEKASELFPEDPDLELTRARLLTLEDRREEALRLYEELLPGLSAYTGRPWYEYALLGKDKGLRLSAFAKALKEEPDEYQDYILDLRLPFAEALIDEGLYSAALRELKIYAQISFEKGKELLPEYERLLALIPEGTEADENNRDRYIDLSRPVMLHIFRDAPTVPMVVLDVVAYQSKYPVKAVVPMLKIKGLESDFLFISAKESGILPGDNRGKVYDITLRERPGKSPRPVLATPTDLDPRDLFPVEYGFITGYNPEAFAYHVINPKSNHHYLPGKPGDYEPGTYVSYVHFYEKGVREYLLSTRPEAEEVALAAFPVVSAVVAQVYDGKVYIVTDDGHQGSFDVSRAPFELTQGDTLALRGFIFKKKDKYSGDRQEVFVTLAIEPLPPDLLA